VYQRVARQGVRLVRARRISGGFDLLRVEANDQFDAITVKRAVARLDRIERLIDVANALTGVKLEEYDPRPGNIGFGSLGYSGFEHVWLGLVDEDRVVRSRTFSGEIESIRQAEQLPLRTAQDELEPAFDAIEWKPAPVDGDVGAFVLDRWRASRPLEQRNLLMHGLALVLQDTAPSMALPDVLEALDLLVDHASPEALTNPSTIRFLLTAVTRISGVDLERVGRPLPEALRAFAKSQGVSLPHPLTPPAAP
jgi:hypothetical protein